MASSSEYFEKESDGSESESESDLETSLRLDLSSSFSEKFFESDEQSEKSDEEPEEVSEEPKPKRGKAKVYKLWHHFDEVAAFEQFWKEEKSNWRCDWKADIANAEIEYWLCKFNAKKSKGNDCRVRLKIIYSLNEESVRLELSDDQHKHEASEKLFTDELKDTMGSFVSMGFQPAQILNALRQKGISKLPTLRQVQNFVARQRSKAGTAPFTFDQLQNYCSQNSGSAAGDDEPFVVDSKIDEAQSRFFVLWTTKNLWNLQLSSLLLQVDSTYSIVYNLKYWEDYPIQVLGFSDVSKKFHPTMLAISSNENTWVYKSIFDSLSKMGFNPEYLMADGASAITSACKEIWPDTCRLMCFAHVFRNIDKYFKQLTEVQCEMVKRDIYFLQTAKNLGEFQTVSKLMLLSWRNAKIDAFSNYFEKTWVTSAENCWFEGASPYISNNNGLEATNRCLKQVHTLRRRMKFTEFTKKAPDICAHWSKTIVTPAVQPTISPTVFKEAYVLHKTKKPLWGKPKSGQFIENYLFSSSKMNFQTPEEIRNAAIQTFRDINAWPTWEEYIQHRYTVYATRHSPLGEFCECTCRYGSKKQMCKHSVIAMVQDKLAEFPPGCASSTPLRGLRKRGRSKADTGRPPKSEKQKRFA